jgi:CRP-like cAMP-binding protein
MATVISGRLSKWQTVVLKISAFILKQEFDRGGELQKILLNYTQTRLNEVSQLAVCNRHHTIEERLARWLLTVQDLTQYQELPLTQEFIGNMLGCRRSGVTIAAGTLQKAGLISYTRGKIHVLNRNALEDAACECYQLFHDNVYRD